MIVFVGFDRGAEGSLVATEEVLIRDIIPVFFR